MESYTNRPLYGYVGGKNGVKKKIVEMIREVKPDLYKLISPFFGGGSVEILLASEGVEVQAYDVFPALVDFWGFLSGGKAEEVVRKVGESMVIESIDHYKSFLPLLRSEDPFVRACSFYTLIKTSYSARIGTSTKKSRTKITERSLERLKEYHNPNLKVSLGDCFKVIPSHNADFLFLDPPYFKTRHPYYGHDGEHHKGFDHEALSNILRNHEGGFLMTYDNSPEVRALYEGWTEFRGLPMRYNMKNDGSRPIVEELVIIKR